MNGGQDPFSQQRAGLMWNLRSTRDEYFVKLTIHQPNSCKFPQLMFYQIVWESGRCVLEMWLDFRHV
jgi:hypothetical protein